MEKCDMERDITDG
ncbi:hypothetical protein SS209_01584 [Salmonella enterica subsp. enterica serovar Senftenberg str. SS209]|nr:hypothetical protein SS209_01584 [Salmonella enterica subsp. enterica serovar Senftenberg str. SS209]